MRKVRERPGSPLPVSLYKNMKHKACYHSCKTSLLGQKHCIPVPLIPRLSLTEHCRSIKAPKRLRSPTAAHGFLQGSPAENLQMSTLKFHKIK